MSSVTNQLRPKAGVMLEPLLEEIRPCIQRAQTIFSTTHYALPEDYVESLRGFCARYFETPPELFCCFIEKSFNVIYKNDFNGHPDIRSRLLPLARELWDKKRAFEQGVLEGEHPLLTDSSNTRVSLVRKLQDFVEMQIQFGVQWTDELMTLNPDKPFTYQYRSHPKTVHHFMNSFLQAYDHADSDKQQQLKEQVKESDAELVPLFIDLGILRFLQDQTVDIEIFSRAEVQALSLRTASANINVLYEKIFHGKDLADKSVELEIYRDIGQMRSHLDRKRSNILIHTLFLGLSDQFKVRSNPL